VNDALAFMAGLRLEDGRRWGEAATQVQVGDAAAVLDREGPRRHWISRARGYAKTQDAAGWTIAACSTQLPRSATGYAAAADADQARLLVDSIGGFVARTPALQGRVDVQTRKVAFLEAGVDLVVLPADASSSWGLRPAWLVVDELCQWGSTANARAFFDALWSALPKISQARAAIITTSGDPAHWSRKVYDLAVSESGWRCSETPGPPPWMPDEEVEAERRRLTASSFARLFENRWAASEDRLVDPADLWACVTSEARPLPYRSGRRYRIGVDIGLKRDRTIVAAVHAEPAGDARRIVLDQEIVFEGTRDRPVALAQVEEAIVRTWTDYHRPRIVLDPWQAAGLAQSLRRRGASVDEYAFTAQSVGRLALNLHLLLRDRLLSLPDDEALIDELANVRLKEKTPGVYRMDHDSGRHDDRAIAIGLAATPLLAEPAQRSVARSNLRQLRSAVLPEPNHRDMPPGGWPVGY
jgi:hypothetical protein